MASIHKKKLKSGKVIWELTHGTPPNRDRFNAGETRQEAEATLRMYKRQLALHGKAPEAESVEGAMLRYCDHLSLNRSHSTLRRYRRVLETFALCFLPQFHPKVLLLRDIKPAHLDDYKRSRRAGEIMERERPEDAAREEQLRQTLADQPESGTPQANAQYGWLGRKRLARQVTKRTVNYELQTLAGWFRWCIKQNILFLNPAENVELFRLPKKSGPKFMTAPELEAFFNACEKYERRVFSILLLSGMRRGEIEHLEWEDMRLDLGLIFIQAKEDWQPKTNERIIPVSPILHQILTEHRQARRSDRWVIANSVGNRETHLLEKVKKVCRRAKIKPAAATVHALRHSFGAHLRMAGVPLANIADLMGHQDLSTTQIYAKVQVDHLRDAVGRLTPLIPSMTSAETGMSLENVTPDDQIIEVSPKLLETGGLQIYLGPQAGNPCLPAIPSHPSPKSLVISDLRTRIGP